MNIENVPEPQTRLLGLHHMAFFRGYLDGLDLAELGMLYLETGADKVRAKATVRWIRDALIAAARKERPALVKLLAIPTARIEEPKRKVPSLEEFQAERDPQGLLYDEAELVAEFEKAYPLDRVTARRIARNRRLRKRLRDAVVWLEPRVTLTPRAGDQLAAWFDEGVVDRLASVGLITLDALRQYIRRHRRNWYRRVPKVGPVTAQRLEGFLKEHLGDSPVLPSPALIRDTAETGGNFMPLERFTPPSDLTGATGSNRRFGTALAAPDDRSAIEAWLDLFAKRPHTARSYRTQAERFLLWMIFERGKPLSSATTEDCTSYRDFLNALDGNSLWYWRLPRTSWIGPRSIPRWREDWRPFAGPLSPGSQRVAISVLTALFEWLTRRHYLASNPWDGVPAAQTGIQQIRADHSLTVAQWQAVIRSCDELPLNEAYYRIRFALLLGYGTGLRLAELVSAAIALPSAPVGQPHLGLKPARGNSGGWDIEVVGKGKKVRSVPVPDAVMDALADYMEARGLGRDPAAWPGGTPLIATLGGGLQRVRAEHDFVSESALYRLFRNHFRRTAREMDTAFEAGHLMAASTHWLRHTHATHALEAGAELDEVQENLGHSSVATTAVYSHASRKRRKAAVEKLMAFGQRVPAGGDASS